MTLNCTQKLKIQFYLVSKINECIDINLQSNALEKDAAIAYNTLHFVN